MNTETDAFNEWLYQFLAEQKHAQKQMDINNWVMEELFKEWAKYPDGKPEISS